MSDIIVGEEFAVKLADLQKQHSTLEQRRTSANATLNERKKALKRLQDEAVELFGTSDPKELKVELERRQKENHTALITYEKALTQAQTQIEALEQALNVETAVPSSNAQRF